MAKPKPTPEVEAKMKEVIKEWNTGWREYYKKQRIKALFDFPKEALDFLDQFEVTGSYPIYGLLLYGKVGEHKCILKCDHYESGWVLSFNGTKNLKPVEEVLHLSEAQLKKFDTFFNGYNFEGVINALKIAERKEVVDAARDKFKGLTIVDFIKKGSSFHAVLSDGSSYPCGDFLGFRGNLKSVFSSK